MRVGPCGLLVVLLAMWAAVAAAGQPLETESTRLLRAHQFEVEAGFEHQAADGGGEAAVPWAVGYGIRNDLELLLEPVLYDRITDGNGSVTRGLGDLEATLTYRFAQERAGRPALALAFEAKLPTAKSPRIGTGQPDYTIWAIASKAAGHWDTHADLGYTLVGRPARVDVQDIVNYGLATEWKVTPVVELVGEIYGASAALANTGTGGENNGTPELGGADFVTAIGARLATASGWTPSLGVSVDKQGAVTIHPGMSRRF